jgi:hypothetical protein
VLAAPVRVRVEIRGALRFAHRAGLEKGVVAFDDNAYPEFFNSELWSLVGPFATCDTAFEIEPDCDHKRAFMAMARCAVEGVIELRVANEIIHMNKLKSGWWTTPRAEFGIEQPKFLTAWAEKMATAAAADAAKAAKAATKAKSASAVIEVPVVSDVVVRPDGTLAISSGRKIAFFDTLGTPIGEQIAAYFCPDLLALPDGRILGFSESNSSDISIASPDAVTVVKPDVKSFWVTGAAHANGITTFWGSSYAFVLGREAPLPRWSDDSWRDVVAWRDGLLGCTGNELAMLELDGAVRWKTKAYDVLALGDSIVVGNGDSTVSVLAADGSRGVAIETGSIAFGPSKEGARKAWAVENGRLYIAGMTSQRVTEWDLATGAKVSVAHTHQQSHSGLARVAGLTASWCGEPIRGERDTRVVFSRGEEIVDSFDAKGDVMSWLVLGDALAVRTATKIFVWRSIGKVEPVAHPGKILGFAAMPNNQLVTWGADNTVRIW